MFNFEADLNKALQQWLERRDRKSQATENEKLTLLNLATDLAGAARKLTEAAERGGVGRNEWRPSLGAPSLPGPPSRPKPSLKRGARDVLLKHQFPPERVAELEQLCLDIGKSDAPSEHCRQAAEKCTAWVETLGQVARAL